MSVSSLFIPNSYELYIKKIKGNTEFTNNVLIDGDLTVLGSITPGVTPGDVNLSLTDPTNSKLDVKGITTDTAPDGQVLALDYNSQHLWYGRTDGQPYENNKVAVNLSGFDLHTYNNENDPAQAYVTIQNGDNAGNVSIGSQINSDNSSISVVATNLGQEISLVTNKQSALAENRYLKVKPNGVFSNLTSGTQTNVVYYDTSNEELTQGILPQIVNGVNLIGNPVHQFVSGGTGDLDFRGMSSPLGTINFNVTPTNIEMEAVPPPAVITQTNLGSGEPILSDPATANSFHYKTLVAGTNINLVSTPNDITIENTAAIPSAMQPTTLGLAYGYQDSGTLLNNLGYDNNSQLTRGNVIAQGIPNTLVGDKSNVIASVNTLQSNNNIIDSNVMISGDTSEVANVTRSNLIGQSFNNSSDYDHCLYIGDMTNTTPNNYSTCINTNYYGNPITMAKEAVYFGSGKNNITLANQEFHVDTGCPALYYHDLASASTSDVLYYDSANGKITYSAAPASSVTQNNLGAGEVILSNPGTATSFDYKTLVAGTNINLVSTANDITIENTAAVPVLNQVSNAYCTWSAATTPSIASATPQEITNIPTLDPLSSPDWVAVAGGLRYNGTSAKNFIIVCNGYFLPANVGQSITSQISHSTALVADSSSVQYFSPTDTQPHSFSTRQVIQNVQQNDTIKLALGRSTASTTVTLTANLFVFNSSQYQGLTSTFQDTGIITLIGPITSNGPVITMPPGTFAANSVRGTSLRGKCYGRYAAGINATTLGISFLLNASNIFNRTFPNLSGAAVTSNGYYCIDFNCAITAITYPTAAFQCSVVVSVFDSKSDTTTASYCYNEQVQLLGVDISNNITLTSRYVVPNNMTLSTYLIKAVLE